MIINHNIAALNTHRQLGANNNAASANLEKLSSGLQINRAGDDAAGLAISEKMRGQIRGLDMASKNAQDGISLIQTAEGALNETHDILQRMRELAVQSSNDTNTDTDRAELQKEANQLAEELTRIADNTEFNTQNLLNGDFKATFHIGANENQNLKIDINAMGANALGVEGKLEAGTATIKVGDQEFADTNVLKNGDSVVAVEVDGEYYSIGDLVVAKEGSFEAAGSAVEFEQSGGNYSEEADGQVQIGGQTFTGKVLTDDDDDDKVVAVEIEGTFYALDDVSFNAEEGESTLQVKPEVEPLKLEADQAFGSIDISTQEAADAAITKFQTAIDTVSAERSKLGAVQNRLEHTINNLGASSENLTAAESRIRDVDMAKEMMEFTKNNILTQAAQAMLAQANQQPQGVLQLLR